MNVDKMLVDKMTADEMITYKMNVGEMTRCFHTK
jgi:hypothetical protein